MENTWERIEDGKYKLELDGWNFVIEKINSIKDGSRYKFQLYQDMKTPQSASALEVEVNDIKLLDMKFSYEGAIKHIKNYFLIGKVFSYDGIPEPLRSNAHRSLKILN